MRLIDADALKEWIDEYVSVFKKSDKAEIKGYISHQPSIDIVRCKECKWCYKDTDALTSQTVLICQRYNDEDRWARVNSDDFCSYGVKKGADDDSLSM